MATFSYKDSTRSKYDNIHLRQEITIGFGPRVITKFSTALIMNIMEKTGQLH